MGITYYLMIPFTWLLKFFYGFFNNYGLALILFTLVVKVLLFPFSLKGKKGMIQMTMIQGETQKLQKQYGKDQARLNEELNKLYAREGINPMGGCLWTSVPLMILFPLYAIIRRPLKYWLGLNDTVIAAVTEAAGKLGIATGGASPEIGIASALYKDNAILSAAQAAAGEARLYGINFKFLGVDLSATPTPKFWTNGWSWASIGLILIPVICVVTSFLSSQVMMKTNEINGQSSQASGQTKFMQYLSPLMMLWFSFIMPAGMGLYMIISNALMMAQEVICSRMLKKDYEKAAEARRLREIEEKEEEKRLRREKAEQKARELEEAKKNKGKKKPRETADGEGTSPERKAASREGMRQYARGRDYDPDRYGGVTPYHEDVEAVKRAAEKAAKKAARQAEAEKAAPETVTETAEETVETPAETVEEAAEAPAETKEAPEE